MDDSLISKNYSESRTNRIHNAKHPLIQQASKTHHSYNLQFQDGFDKFIPYTSSQLLKKGLLNHIKFPKKDLPSKLFNVITRSTIEFKDLHDDISYIAISYVWPNDWINSKYIEKNTFDGVHWRIHSITEEGLNRIFSHTQSLGFEYLWIDVLCIDQNLDKLKKMKEAANMNTYYSYASTCLIYLESPNQEKQFNLEGLSKIPKWFTRVWTLQEGWLPMQCLYLIDGESDKARFLTDYHFFHFINTVKEKLQGKEKIELESALNITRGSWIPTPLCIKEQLNFRSCFKETDKFFGVLGLYMVFLKAVGSALNTESLDGDDILSVDIALGRLLSGEALTWWLMCDYFKIDFPKVPHQVQKIFGWQKLKSDCMPPDHSGCVIYTANTSFIDDKIRFKDVFFASGSSNGLKVNGMIVLALRAIGREWNVRKTSDNQIIIEGIEFKSNQMNKAAKTKIRAAIFEVLYYKNCEYIVEGP
ncbi:hypothetical protein HK096_000383, partial [Nowakowskiella sp. JEL0078]